MMKSFLLLLECHNTNRLQTNSKTMEPLAGCTRPPGGALVSSKMFLGKCDVAPHLSTTHFILKASDICNRRYPTMHFKDSDNGSNVVKGPAFVFHQSESKWPETGQRRRRQWPSQFVFRSVAEIQRWTISSHFLWQRDHKQPGSKGTFAHLTSSSCHSVAFFRCPIRDRDSLVF